jgi:hypothetical protein
MFYEVRLGATRLFLQFLNRTAKKVLHVFPCQIHGVFVFNLLRLNTYMSYSEDKVILQSVPTQLRKRLFVGLTT